ncbi:MAG: 50S ribosomal protein L10 [Deltaproteobacteria bacterium]|nr:50S ribosomal protein L10 [Deltaproteobacteria bacterium]
MKREEKEKLVGELKDRFQRATATFLMDFTGVTVERITGYRKTLRDASVELKVVRNTLARLAVKGSPAESSEGCFDGATAVAFSFKDAASAAKALTKFAKEDASIKLKAATLGAKLLGPEEIRALADLPSREELLARLLGALQNTSAGLVGVLSAVPRSLVYALSAVQKVKDEAG